MSSSSDPFSERFDSIEVDPASAPSAAAIEHALAMCATEDLDTPGFSLLDDAGGRFVVDRDMGVISLANEGLLSTERNSVHDVRLRVVEPSGATYVQNMQLRITGRVPQMLGAEEFGFLVDLAGGGDLNASPAPLPPRPPTPIAPAIPVDWSQYAAAYATHRKPDLTRTRRAFIAAQLPPANSALSSATLALGEAPPRVGGQGPWSL